MRDITTLLVDDEPLGRDNLRRMLEDHSDFVVIGECERSSQALTWIREHSPDVVFLDVRMPGGSGLSLLDELGPEERPYVVFVTAFEEFALEAFRVGAIDYVLKPIERSRFDAAVRRARDQVALNDESEIGRVVSGAVTAVIDERERSGARSVAASRIQVRQGGLTSFVDTGEIVRVEADGAYVILRTRTASHRLRSSMADIERRLRPTEFVRVHRSHLVRISEVRSMEPYFHGDAVLLLKDGTRLRLSRRRREAVMKALGVD